MLVRTQPIRLFGRAAAPEAVVALAGLLLLPALAAGCTRPTADPDGTGPTGEVITDAAQATAPDDITPAAGGEGLDRPIIVGSKNFTEEFILGHMYALLLEAAGFEVDREIGIGATPIAHAALLKGEIDLYPEYTSTALITVLEADPIQDREAVYQAVSEAYAERFDLVWLDPSPFNNPQALATRHDVSQEHGVTTYSQLADVADQLTIGGPPEFFEREDGLPGLQAAYGGFDFAETRQLDPGLRYEALVNGDIDVVVAFGTDGQISGFDLVLLDDDQGFFTPYPVAPVLRGDVLRAEPGIAPILNALAPRLTNEIMQVLNWSVDGPDKREPEDVARDFLISEGLIE